MMLPERSPANSKNAARLFLFPVLTICLVLMFASYFEEELRPRDYLAWYAAGQLLLSERAELYNPELQADRQKQAGMRLGFFPFAYPAFVALPFAPLSLLSLKTFYYVIQVFNVLLLLSCLHLVRKRLLMGNQRGEQTLMLISSLAFPVYFNLIAGQLAFVSLLFFSLLVSDLHEKRESAGYWVAALFFKPTLMVLPLGLLCLRRQWSALGRAISVAAGLSFLSLGLVGWDGLHSQIRMLSQIRDREVILRMHNLRALSHYFGADDAGWLVLSAIVVLLLGLSLRRGGLNKRALMVLLIAVVLVSPQLHTYDLSILLLLLALGVPTSAWHQRMYFLLAMAPISSVWFAFPVIPLVLATIFAWLIGTFWRESCRAVPAVRPSGVG